MTDIQSTIINQNDELTGTQVLEFCTTLEQALKSALAPQIGERIVKKAKENITDVFSTDILHLDVDVFQKKLNDMIQSENPLETFKGFDLKTQFLITQILVKHQDYFEHLLERYITSRHINESYRKLPLGEGFVFNQEGGTSLNKLITTLKSVLPNQTQSSLESKESLTKPGFHGIITPERLREKMPDVPTYIQQKDGTYMKKLQDGTTYKVSKLELGQQEIYAITMTVNNDTRERVFGRNGGIQKLYKMIGVEYKECASTQEATTYIKDKKEATTYIKDKIFQKYNNDPQFTKAFEIKDWFYYNMSQSDRITLRTLIAKYQQDCNMEGIFPGYQNSDGDHCGAGNVLYLRLPVSVDGNPVCLGSNSDESNLGHGDAGDAHLFAC